MKCKKWLWVHLGLLAVGGVAYMLIELLWRRRTHWSMFLVGGTCFTLIGSIHTRLRRVALPVRCGICAAAVTAVELVSGCVLNLWLGLGVWDYSGMPLNIKGQVCLLYSGLWMALSAAAQPVYAFCRRLLERGAGRLPARRPTVR